MQYAGQLGTELWPQAMSDPVFVPTPQEHILSVGDSVQCAMPVFPDEVLPLRRKSLTLFYKRSQFYHDEQYCAGWLSSI